MLNMVKLCWTDSDVLFLDQRVPCGALPHWIISICPTKSRYRTNWEGPLHPALEVQDEASGMTWKIAPVCACAGWHNWGANTPVKSMELWQFFMGTGNDMMIVITSQVHIKYPQAKSGCREEINWHHILGTIARGCLILGGWNYRGFLPLQVWIVPIESSHSGLCLWRRRRTAEVLLWGLPKAAWTRNNLQRKQDDSWTLDRMWWSEG